MERILITGASGFIGSFIVEEALRRGMEVWAGVRATSSRKYLQDSRIRFMELDFAHPDRLHTQLSAQKAETGTFDYIVHCAGVTKCAHSSGFDEVNFRQTARFADTLRELDMVPRQFIFVSTLSVFGALHEQDYSPIREQDTPSPNTAYGRSKLKAEQYLQSLSGFPYVFYRPTGVYGPRESDYFLMAKSIRNHVDVSVGFRRQDLTFVYVKDVVRAIFLGIEKGVSRRAYFLSDGQVYRSRTFSDLIRRELGNPWMVRITFPLFVLKAVSWLGGIYSRTTGKGFTLNPDKYNIMKQRNWRCDIAPTVDELGYQPEYDLDRGVCETIAWYKNEGWL